MNKEERVREIARDIPFLTLEREVFVSYDRKENHGWTLSEEDTTAIAEVLCNKGYRKESETAKEIRDRIIANKNMPEPIKNEWKKWFNKEYGVKIEE